MKIKEFFTDSSMWIQGTYALTDKGTTVWGWDPNAVRWCLVGAVQKCYSESSEVQSVVARMSIKLKMPPAVWNDASERTFDEVKTLVTELDI